MIGDRHQLLAAALISGIVLSVVAFAGPAAAVTTSVTGADEVTKPDQFTITSTVEFHGGEEVPIENYTLTLRPEGEAEESVNVTFAPDGTVVDVDPARGVVGEGEIRVTQLRNSLTITPFGTNGSDGYGYGYGYGYGNDSGYGYGVAGSTTFEVGLDSKAFRAGEYATFLTVNTANETGLYRSNVETFTVELPSQDPPESPADDEEGEQDDGGGIEGVDIDPGTLNLASDGKWVTGYVELPDRNLTAVNVSTVEANGVPAADDPPNGFVFKPALQDRDGDGAPELMVKFPRGDLGATLDSGQAVDVTVTGDVGNDTFSVSDTIRVVDPTEDRGGHEGAEEGANHGEAPAKGDESEDDDEAGERGPNERRPGR